MFRIFRIRLIVLSLGCLLSSLVCAGNQLLKHVPGTLTFYNNTHETIDVVVNQDPTKGVPIGDDGLELSYVLINVICAANLTHCQTGFTSQGRPVGSAEIDVTTGTLINYQEANGYRVILDSSEVPLRTVTFNKR